MTRDQDHKVGLHRRVDIARNAGADTFLSIHVDRVEDRDVQGASVYTLADEASDVETAELAARENRADIVADVDLSEGYDEEVARVLISMVQQNTMNCSAVLAATLLPELGRVAPLINRPHRFGNFRVLKAPDIPSVLVELGFLSNDQDAERLQSESPPACVGPCDPPVARTGIFANPADPAAVSPQFWRLIDGSAPVSPSPTQVDWCYAEALATPLTVRLAQG